MTDKNAVNDLYLLQDGTHVAQGECTLDKRGVLRHKNGLAVAIDGDGKPQTVGDDAVRNKNVMEAERAKNAVAEAAKMADVNAGRILPDEPVHDLSIPTAHTPPPPHPAPVSGPASTAMPPAVQPKP